MGVPGLSQQPSAGCGESDDQRHGRKIARRKRYPNTPKASAITYSYDRSVQHIQHPGFAVKRLNVAVVLNQNAPALKNWKPEQTTQLTALLNNAAGDRRATWR
ncbi:flagellar M-ring protein FliF C-terminal domain-containing protein [Escherichia coli]|nr:flagellar M-ring protein FliF C-terminal domain-containing protein [Escherichia coli]